MQPRPLHVLHYTGYDHDRGGINASIRHLAGAGVFRCTLGVGASFRGAALPGLEVLRLPAIEGERIGLVNLIRARRVAFEVRKWLRTESDRIFHGHSRAGLLVALWLQWLGEPRVVASVHCYGRQRWFYRVAKRRLGAQLRWLTPAMHRYYYGSTSTNWSGCVPNGLPGAPVPAMRRWNGQRPLRVGGVGQLTENKRWDLIIDALPKLPSDARVEYHHAGGPADDPESKNYAQRLVERTRAMGRDARVCWQGWQPSSAGVLETVDALVVPFHRESFSLVALEALYAGLPVIAARGGGPDDLIVEGVNGWFFPPGDAGALAKIWQSLLEPAAWSGLRMDRAHLERFAIDRVAGQWREIYRSLRDSQ